MGREIRKVPPHWEHPTQYCSHSRKCQKPGLELGICYRPLFNKNYKIVCDEWYLQLKEFNPSENYKYFHEYAGSPPVIYHYVPYDPESELNTWFQLYETVSEGTPVSPAFASKEELADYLSENGDYWDQIRRRDNEPGIECSPWGKENAYRFVFGSGWAPSMIVENGKVHRGFEVNE
ncbi:MAG: hypothetical protein IPI17_02120 [Nitrosomonas sp.]|nr:hypothetical protein [Nitrosomonas sp.]